MKVSDRLFSIMIFSVCFLLYYVYWIIPMNKFEKKHFYTIARITDFEGGIEPNYEFVYQGKVFTSCFFIEPDDLDKFHVGTKILVKFYHKNPNFVDVIYEYKVADTLILPSKGYWRVFPSRK